MKLEYGPENVAAPPAQPAQLRRDIPEPSNARKPHVLAFLEQRLDINAIAADEVYRFLDRLMGGLPRANISFRTLKQYVKYLLQHADRRFAREPNRIFFMFDLLEKLNIQSANRHMVHYTGSVRRRDVMNDDGSYVSHRSTLVPYIIKSSFAYQKKQSLTLRTIFNHLGKPQLFLTFSCDDFAAHFNNACNDLKPWEDTPRFATAFNRRWHHFVNNVTKGHFASIVGGIQRRCVKNFAKGTGVKNFRCY